MKDDSGLGKVIAVAMDREGNCEEIIEESGLTLVMCEMLKWRASFLLWPIGES